MVVMMVVVGDDNAPLNPMQLGLECSSSIMHLVLILASICLL